jgi:hypothetical protein
MTIVDFMHVLRRCGPEDTQNSRAARLEAFAACVAAPPTDGRPARLVGHWAGWDVWADANSGEMLTSLSLGSEFTRLGGGE